MKHRPRRNSSRPHRVWFKESDFEDLAEAALLRNELLPLVPAPVNIEVFVELEFGFHVTFEPMPACRLGRTAFGEDGEPTGIVISSSLDDLKRRRVNRQCRATIAHECGHCLAHKAYFRSMWASFRKWEESGRDEAMFPAELRRPRASLRRLEFQAFRIMASLLVPRRLLLKALETTSFAKVPPRCWTRGDLEVLVEHVSDVFDVSREFAERRIRSFFGI